MTDGLVNDTPSNGYGGPVESPFDRDPVRSRLPWMPAPRRAYLDAGRRALRCIPSAREAFLAALDEGWADPRRLHARGPPGAAVAGRRAGGDRRPSLGARTPEVGFAGVAHGRACTRAVLGTARAGRRRPARLAGRRQRRRAGGRAATPRTYGGDRRVRSGSTGTAGSDAQEFVGGAAARTGVAIACLQRANGEVGTLQPDRGGVRGGAERRGAAARGRRRASIGHVRRRRAWDLLAPTRAPGARPGGLGVLVSAIRGAVAGCPTAGGRGPVVPGRGQRARGARGRGRAPGGGLDARRRTTPRAAGSSTRCARASRPRSRTWTWSGTRWTGSPTS